LPRVAPHHRHHVSVPAEDERRFTWSSSPATRRAVEQHKWL
jgi:hypothetical protein